MYQISMLAELAVASLPNYCDSTSVWSRWHSYRQSRASHLYSKCNWKGQTSPSQQAVYAAAVCSSCQPSRMRCSNLRHPSCLTAPSDLPSQPAACTEHLLGLQQHACAPSVRSCLQPNRLSCCSFGHSNWVAIPSRLPHLEALRAVRLGQTRSKPISCGELSTDSSWSWAADTYTVFSFRQPVTDRLCRGLLSGSWMVTELRP